MKENSVSKEIKDAVANEQEINPLDYASAISAGQTQLTAAQATSRLFTQAVEQQHHDFNQSHSRLVKNVKNILASSSIHSRMSDVLQEVIDWRYMSRF